MKKLYTLLTLIVFGFEANAQITLLSTDMAQIGDHIVRYVDTIPSYGPGGAGANQIWDFSNAVIEDTAETWVVSVGSTPYASTFVGSDIAMHNGEGSYLYFQTSSVTLTTTGAAGDLLATGEIIQAPFSNNLQLQVFPRQFGNYFNDTYSFQAEADGAAFSVYRIRLTHSGHVYDTTDAYGTLITPYGTYDALRVKVTDYTTDVIEVKLASFLPWTPFTTVQDTSVSYTWHAKQEKLAIAEFSYDSIGNPKQLVFSTVPPPIATDVVSNESSSSTYLYPSPATDRVCLSGNATLNGQMVEITGVDGKVIYRKPMTENCIDVSELVPGMYLMRLTQGDGTLEKALRFIIER